MRPAAAAAPMDPGFLGVNSNPSATTPLDMTYAAGVRWLRIFVKWDLVEPVEGQFALDGVRAEFLRAHQAGFSILAVLNKTPQWARRAACANDRSCPPRDAPAGTTQYFGRFARRMAQEFGDMVAAWELWNEPNLSWQQKGGTAADYQRLIFLPGSWAIKVEVVSGKRPGLVVAPALGGTDFGPWVLGGAGGYAAPIDAVSHHVYSSVQGVKDAIGKANAFVGTHCQGGCEPCPHVWLTEFAFSINDDPCDVCWLTAVSDPAQAIIDIFNFFWNANAALNVDRLFYFPLEGGWGCLNNPCDIPLLKSGGTPRAKFCRIARYMGRNVPQCP